MTQEEIELSSNPVKVLITCSEEDSAHNSWVEQFAKLLQKCGIETRIYPFDLIPGDLIAQVVEQSVNESEYVLFICTPAYKKQIEQGTGCERYVKKIVDGQRYSNENERKICHRLNRKT